MIFTIDDGVFDRPVTVLHRDAGEIAGAGTPAAAARPRRDLAQVERPASRSASPWPATVADASGRRWLVRVAAAAAPPEAAAQPKVSIRGTAVDEGDGRRGPPAKGFFSTRGNRIVDALGRPVKLAGVNWFGAESPTFAPHGLWVRGYREMMDQMAGLGFNTIRLPFSDALLEASSTPNGIDFAKNPDLRGLSGLEILDRVVAYAGEVGLRSLLDHHRSGAGTGVSDNGLWYDAAYPESKWISNWQRLAERYAGNPTVIGADLHNEPYNGHWGGGGPTDWPAAAERAGDAIHAVNPDWLIVVEGVAVDGGKSYWWGGNLKGAARRPVRLKRPDKLVYSAHDYPNSIFTQSWFSDPRYPANLPGVFSEFWGYLHRREVAPLVVGEFGSRLVDPKDTAWFNTITAYLGGDYDADGQRDAPAGEPGISWTWWSWNPNSGDTGGILADDWTTVNAEKIKGLKPIMFDWRDAGGGSASVKARFTVTLSRAATTTVEVRYRTAHGTTDGHDLKPASGTLTFRPGERRKTIAVPVLGDDAAEPDERFRVEIVAAEGAAVGRRSAVGVIRDDD